MQVLEHSNVSWTIPRWKRILDTGYQTGCSIHRIAEPFYYTMSTISLYCAPWVFPVRTRGIKDGAVVVEHERILDAGPRSEMVDLWKDAEIHELSGLLIPPLINCHTHLELSHIDDLEPLETGANMVDWIERLLVKRLRDGENRAAIRRAGSAMVAQQKDSGVILLVDIGNSRLFSAYQSWKDPEIYHIQEILAPNRNRTVAMEKELGKLGPQHALCPHAPYSTTAELIQFLKKRSRETGTLFSIHVAESPQEKDFITKKSGPFRYLLEKRKSWDNTIPAKGIYSGSVDYLDKLEVLDERTLCVHCVNIDDKEIQILARKKAHVCLCPGSNRFLGVGIAPLEEMLEADILPCIGTDSRASNPNPDMWNEMRILREDHATVSAATILKMATYAGASALGRLDDFGTLDKGKRAVFLEVDITGISRLDEEAILEQLICEDSPRRIRWITATEPC